MTETTVRDEKEQLEFIAIERDGDRLVARFRNVDAAGMEWIADRSQIETRIASLITHQAPRGATLAALSHILAREMNEP